MDFLEAVLLGVGELEGELLVEGVEEGLGCCWWWWVGGLEFLELLVAVFEEA